MREVTVAVMQMKPELGEPATNLDKMSDMISAVAGTQRVDLVIFPELITSGYELGVRFTEVAQRIDGPTVNFLAQRASEHGLYIAFGMVTKEKVESVLYNAAVLVGPEGEIVEEYRKVHLRGEERMAFKEGIKLPVTETDFGAIGLMLGWDLAFPEVARSLVLDGAEMLCVLANWDAQEMEEWQVYARARAYENATFVAVCNRVGEDVTMNFGGQSMIVGPRGEMYASLVDHVDETGAALEGYAVATIDLDDVRVHRETLQTLQGRQPSIYRSIVRKY
ncbi:MAG: carbon-nitrogen hydrolase family protein [Anaerolineae bacterium]|nr:carbon-nitrogen hydrolase family protein [Anaerolineae bacterium]